MFSAEQITGSLSGIVIINSRNNFIPKLERDYKDVRWYELYQQ